jgi:hypothetical protein
MCALMMPLVTVPIVYGLHLVAQPGFLIAGFLIESVTLARRHIIVVGYRICWLSYMLSKAQRSHAVPV